MSTTADHLELRSFTQDAPEISAQDGIDTAFTALGRHQTSVATAAPQPQLQLVHYRQATFHTLERDHNYAYPFEAIPYLLVTGRHSASTLPRSEIVFRLIGKQGHATTREMVVACRTFAATEIGKRLGVALQTYAIGEPNTEVTKKATNKEIGCSWEISECDSVALDQPRSKNGV
jgi:hypothetical protein